MKVFDIDDEKKLAHVYDKRMGADIEGDSLGDEYKGFVFRCAPLPLKPAPASLDVA